MSGTPPDVAWTSEIDEVVITVPKTNGGTSNKWDKLLSTLGNATDLATSIVNKNNTTNDSILAKLTKGTVIETGLDNQTKIFLGVLVAGVVGLFYFKK